MNVDVIIIGSGQAGVPLATRLAAAGKRVLLAEREALGGTCVNYGCTPTKTMIASARAAQVARTASRLGVFAEGVRVDFGAVVARKDAVVRRWVDGVRRRLTAAGDRLVLVEGHARFVGAREVEVAGQRHHAETVIINVGARPSVPKMEGLGDVPWLDNHRLMNLRELPAHLVVVGGGYVGCEFAQMFRRFGAKVTITGRAEHLLPQEDVEVSQAIEQVFRDEGIDLRLGKGARVCTRRDGGVCVAVADGGEVSGSHVLVATGRVPNTDDLGCKAAGVECDDKGFIVVGEHFETAAPGVYAVGDATPQPQFTHASWDDHRILFEHLMGRPSRTRGGRNVPSTVFTDPQVARVGLTEKEARARGVEHEVATMPFGSVARAIETDETAGVLKVVIDPKSERILGAAIVGAEAGELIHVFVALMQAGASARAIVDAQFVHPTFAEGVQSVVMRLDRYALTKS
jgi:pyruvate/2-oxoglutarate dehydrogenase complex dihydrolipoamide dehydrogenase (E3) component